MLIYNILYDCPFPCCPADSGGNKSLVFPEFRSLEICKSRQIFVLMFYMNRTRQFFCKKVTKDNFILPFSHWPVVHRAVNGCSPWLDKSKEFLASIFIFDSIFDSTVNVWKPIKLIEKYAVIIKQRRAYSLDRFHWSDKEGEILSSDRIYILPIIILISSKF